VESEAVIPTCSPAISLRAEFPALAAKRGASLFKNGWT